MQELVQTAPATRVVHVKERIFEINRQAENLYVETGTLLKEYKDGGYYRTEGYGSFDDAITDYQSKGYVTFGPRNARHFIDVVDMMIDLKLGTGDIKDLGISKLREIASVRDEAGQRKLLAEAKDKSYGEVQKAAREMRDKLAGRETDPWTPLVLKTTDSQAEFFNHCISAARAAYKLPDDMPPHVILIDCILADWHSSIDTIQADEVS